MSRFCMSEAGGPGGENGRAGDDDLHAIREYVGEFVDRAGFELDTVVRREDDSIVIALEGPDSALLLDRRGELLEAIQVVLSKALPRLTGISERIAVDCEDYRLAREREIADVARATADKVKQDGAPCELSPMNPYERRIVHLALQDDQHVTTASTGEGFVKRVTIYPSRPTPK